MPAAFHILNQLVVLRLGREHFLLDDFKRLASACPNLEQLSMPENTIPDLGRSDTDLRIRVNFQDMANFYDVVSKLQNYGPDYDVGYAKITQKLLDSNF